MDFFAALCGYDDLMQTSATHAVSISIDLSGQPSGAFVLAARIRTPTTHSLYTSIRHEYDSISEYKLPEVKHGQPQHILVVTWSLGGLCWLVVGCCIHATSSTSSAMRGRHPINRQVTVSPGVSSLSSLQVHRQSTVCDKSIQYWVTTVTSPLRSEQDGDAYYLPHYLVRSSPIVLWKGVSSS